MLSLQFNDQQFSIEESEVKFFKSLLIPDMVRSVNYRAQYQVDQNDVQALLELVRSGLLRREYSVQELKPNLGHEERFEVASVVRMIIDKYYTTEHEIERSLVSIPKVNDRIKVLYPMLRDVLNLDISSYYVLSRIIKKYTEEVNNQNVVNVWIDDPIRGRTWHNAPQFC